MTRKIENTTETAKANPIPFFAQAAIMGSGAIERQEAEGQRQLVESTQIPTQLMHGLTEAHLHAMGIIVGDPLPDDKLFREARLPHGWTKRATDHAMWSDILDDRGRIRLRVFYKAAFYDRKAHMSGVKRYMIDSAHSDGYETRWVTLTDCGASFRTWPARGPQEWDAQDRDEAEAKAYLDEHFPDWEDPSKYWD